MARTYSAEYVNKIILETKEAAQAATDLGKVIQEQDKKIQTLQDTIDQKFKNTDKSTNKLVKGLKRITGLFKGALGAGIVLKAFDLLKDTFMSNQKVADVFSTVMETISLVFNQVVDAVVKGNGEFNALGKVLQNVLNIGLAPFKAAFEGISLAILSARKAFLEFTGGSDDEISALNTKIQETKDNLLGIYTGVVDSGKAIAENIGAAIDQIKEINVTAAYETAKANIELKKTAEVAAVVNQGLIEKYDRQAELQRQIRDDESKSIEERIAANEELGRILDEQETAMLKQVDMLIASAQAQYDKNQNQENYIALLEAQNEKEAVLAQITGFKSEQLVNENSLIKEQMDLKNEAQEKEAEAEEKRLEDKARRAENEKKIIEQVANSRKAAVDQAIDLFGAETAAGKAALIAKQILGAQEMIAEARKTITFSSLVASRSAAAVAEGTAQTAKIGFPQNIPMLIGYGLQAAGIISAIAGAVGKSKSVASSLGGGGGGSIPQIQAPQVVSQQAPDFNVVGASGMNQLAETIAGAQAKPQRAYVVANDVTTAQGMDRNIVEGASI